MFSAHLSLVLSDIYMQVFTIAVCDLPETVIPNTCSTEGSTKSLIFQLDVSPCDQWAASGPLQINIETHAGGRITAELAISIGYVFDLSSGSAIYSPSADSLVIDLQYNQTVGSQAAADPYSFSFCVQAMNPMQTATGAKLQVTATVGAGNLLLKPAYFPGIQVG